jgi:uncharacterized integral membrane protein
MARWTTDRSRTIDPANASLLPAGDCEPLPFPHFFHPFLGNAALGDPMMEDRLSFPHPVYATAPMRLLQLLIALLFVAAGVVVGWLNPQSMTLDFYFRHVEIGVGVAMLLAVLAGALLGGLAVTAGVVWPLRRRLRRVERDAALKSAAGPASSPLSSP